MQERGADLVVFFNAPIDVITGHDVPDALHVLADPRRSVYDPLGTTRISKLALALGSVGPALAALRDGHLPSLTRSDMQRLGADTAVADDGEIVLLHRAESPDDRLAPSELVAALA